MLDVYYQKIQNLLDLQIAERERATSRELKPESGRESGGQRAGEGATVGEREREWRLASGKRKRE
jgi:hypothetical protein